MSESIANRVGRLLSGGVNALIDAVENAAPEAVMEQALREVDGAVDEVRAELGKVLAAKHLATKRLADENRRHEELGERIELALRESRDDLAEAAVAKQFDIEAQIPVLESTITDAAARQKELESYVAALQARRRKLEAELNAFRASRATAAAAGAGESAQAAGNGAARKVERAESAFARVMSAASGVPTAPGATGKDARRLAELEELVRRNRIKERLAQIRARAGGA
jgi:phage shock protein A